MKKPHRAGEPKKFPDASQQVTVPAEKRPQEPGEVVSPRRAFLKTFGVLGAIELLRDGVKDDLGLRLVNSVEATVSGRFEWQRDKQERLTLLGDILFQPAQIFDVIAARNHPTHTVPNGAPTYAAEWEAYREIKNACENSDFSDLDEPRKQINASHSELVLGSCYANRRAAEIMGTPDQPKFSVKGEGFTASLKYAISVSPNQAPHAGTRRGVAAPEPRRILITQDGDQAPPVFNGTGQLVQDFLLVTRLPRVYGHTDVVLLSGVYAPGTRAVVNLLRELRKNDLIDLADATRQGRFYQALFSLDVEESEFGLLPRKDSLRLIKNSIATNIVKISHRKG